MVTTYQLTVIYELLDIRVLIHVHFFLLYRCCAFTYFFFFFVHFQQKSFSVQSKNINITDVSDKKNSSSYFYSIRAIRRKDVEIRARNSSFSFILYIPFHEYTLSNFSSYFTSTNYPPRDIFKTRSWSTAGQRAIPLNFARDHVSATEICATLKEGNIPVETGEKERESE